MNKNPDFLTVCIWKSVFEMLISSISRQKFFDIHEENCSLLSSTSPAFIYLKFVCDEMLWAWFWKARYWQHETFLETNWRWGDTNFMSHAPLWVTWVHRIIFFNFWSFYKPSRFSIVPFALLLVWINSVACVTLFFYQNPVVCCTVVSHTMEKLWFLFKNWTPRIWLNTFVPNSSISQTKTQIKVQN